MSCPRLVLSTQQLSDGDERAVDALRNVMPCVVIGFFCLQFLLGKGFKYSVGRTNRHINFGRVALHSY